MRYLTYQAYNSEFISKGQKAKAYFNPDNSVAIFQEEDEIVRLWVNKNAAKLKGNNFYLNSNSVKKILATAEGEIEAKTKKENKVKPRPKKDAVDLSGVFERLDLLEAALEAAAPAPTPIDASLLLKAVEETTSVKQLKEVIIDFLKTQ